MVVPGRGLDEVFGNEELNSVKGLTRKGEGVVWVIGRGLGWGLG